MDGAQQTPQPQISGAGMLDATTLLSIYLAAAAAAARMNNPFLSMQQQQQTGQPAKRGRGRPPGSGKKPRLEGAPSVGPSGASAVPEPSIGPDGLPVKRGRGRPKGSKDKKPRMSKAAKAAAAAAAAGGMATTSGDDALQQAPFPQLLLGPQPEGTKRGRGRPKGSKNKPRPPPMPYEGEALVASVTAAMHVGAAELGLEWDGHGGEKTYGYPEGHEGADECPDGHEQGADDYLDEEDGEEEEDDAY